MNLWLYYYKLFRYISPHYHSPIIYPIIFTIIIVNVSALNFCVSANVSSNKYAFNVRKRQFKHKIRDVTQDKCQKYAFYKHDNLKIKKQYKFWEKAFQNSRNYLKILVYIGKQIILPTYLLRSALCQQG